MFGTLHRKLLALFFLVALIPSLGLTLFVTQYLAKSLAALRNPQMASELAGYFAEAAGKAATLPAPAENKTMTAPTRTATRKKAL